MWHIWERGKGHTGFWQNNMRTRYTCKTLAYMTVKKGKLPPGTGHESPDWE